MEDIKEEYEFEGVATYQIYYNETSNYGIYNMNVGDTILPHSKKSLNSTFITLAGRCQKLNIGVRYKITASIEYNKKYNNYQYSPINIKPIKPSTKEDNLLFLKSLMPQQQAENLLNAYPNIINMIIDGNDTNIDLSKVKGVGEATYNKIKTNVIDNYAISDLLTMLKPLGITISQIKKIGNSDTNIILLKEKIMKNPYMLTRIKGLGFIKVDNIAIKINPDIKISRERVIAFINYFFTELGDSKGDTLCKTKDLIKECSNIMPECIDILKEFLNNKELNSKFLFMDNDVIGLNRYVKTEQNIIELLNNINEKSPNYSDIIGYEDSIKFTEERLGFSLTDEQKDAIKSTLNNGVTLITAKAGCVDCDTEFFNGTTWKPISEYNEGDMVLQYTKEGNAELVKPIAYIKEPCDKLWHFKTKYGINQCLSDEHRVVFENSSNKLSVLSFAEVKANHERNEHGFVGRFLTTFNYSGKGIELSEFEIKLMCAVICDGSFSSRNKNSFRCDINIKKERKQKRLEWILNKLNMQYKKRKSVVEGYYVYSFYPPRREKEFSSYWYNCTNEQFKIICDEILHWDGSLKNNRKIFSTTCKQTADFLQFAFATQGLRTTIGIDNRVGGIHKSICYYMNITERNKVGMRNHNIDKKIKINEYKTKDGYKYCFKVPSTMLILRRGDRVFVTGNCGKTVSINGIIDLYNGYYSIGLCSLSAKASRRMKEATGMEAETIHKILGYGKNNKETFAYNKDNKLEYDILIVDEATMINADLMYALISALKPTSKLILVFDTEQLPPIGYGNIATDLLDRNYNKKVLTKVLRQAQDSGILTDANMIREQKCPISKPLAKEVRGVKKDLCYMFRSDKEQMRNIIVNHYMKLISENSIEDCIIIVPRKKNCINSTIEINKIIQDKLIKDDVPFINRGDCKFKLGARVIQRVNNSKKGLINGELGYIINIRKNVRDEFTQKVTDVIDVEFDDGKVVQLTRSDLKGMELGYCLTVHSTQGSEWKHVCVCIDTSHFTLLSSNLLYTALTRAKETCLFVGEPSAFQLCIRKKANRRKTWIRYYG